MILTVKLRTLGVFKRGGFYKGLLGHGMWYDIESGTVRVGPDMENFSLYTNKIFLLYALIIEAFMSEDGKYLRYLDEAVKCIK